MLLDLALKNGVMLVIMTGFIAGVALGQKLVGMGKEQGKGFGGRRSSQVNAQAQRLQSARMAAYKRMQARNESTALANKQFTNTDKAEEIVFEEGFAREFKKEFKDDASGQLLNSIRNTLREFNAWVKSITGGLLDLNMSMAIFFIVRGIRRIILEKQYPNAWQMIWWASSILRGWRFV